MAGRATKIKGPEIPSNSLVASAVRYPSKSATIYHPTQEWQRECYRHFAICGEAQAAALFFGHALSKAKLYVADQSPDGPQPVTAGTGFDALAQLFNGKDGQEEMLTAAGQHLTIAGEFYLVGREVDDELGGRSDLWEIISIIEMKVTGAGKAAAWSIDYGDGTPPVKLNVGEGGTDVVIRVWTPSPARRIEAHSPFRSLLPILSEIEWLTRNIFSQVSSRLTGAGILFLPSEITFPPPPEIDGKPAVYANEAEGVMMVLADAMMDSLKGDGSASERVPITITAPGEYIDKARLLHFWSDLDAAIMEMRREAIVRFAVGMDMPAENILGMSSNGGTGGGSSNGVSHWGAWQIEESTIKMHVEPMLRVVANAITVGYLRPMIGRPTTEFVASDTASLRLRPDRSAEAFELYDRGLLSFEALLRENGFDVSDIPDPDEYQTWLLRKVASGSATPEQVGVALEALGIADMRPTEETPAVEMPREARPDPSLVDHPTPQGPPGREAAAQRLLAAAEPLVLRALERAGNKMRQKGAQPPGVPSYETHTIVQVNGSADRLLDDAWPTASMCLEGIAPSDEVIPVLEAYCKSLFVTQTPHTRAALHEWLGLGVTL